MASLLDWLQKGAGALVKGVEAIGNPQLAEDPSLMGMMTPEQQAAARQRARQQAALAMQRAAANNVPWYALGAERDSAGQAGFDGFVNTAVASVEELRKRRDSEARRKAVEELVGRISNPEDPLYEQYTPEQRAVIAALDPDQQAAILAKAAFPKESGINVATAGSLQWRTKLPNGNLGIVIQTGDPGKPYKVDDTGIPYYEELPSNVRSAYAFGSDPRLAQGEQIRTQSGAIGTETGKANVAAQMALPETISSTENRIASLQNLQEQLRALPSGQITGRTLQYFSTQFQTARAAMLQEALLNLGALKAQGVNLQPITERELAILMDTSASMTNNAEANVKIIQDRIEALQRIKEKAQSALDWIDAGNDITTWRPGAAPRPAQRGGAPAGGGSSIPTIRKPGQ